MQLEAANCKEKTFVQNICKVIQSTYEIFFKKIKLYSEYFLHVSMLYRNKRVWRKALLSINPLWKGLFFTSIASFVSVDSIRN